MGSKGIFPNEKCTEVTVTMPNSLYERIEKERGLVPRSRYITRIILNYQVTQDKKASKNEKSLAIPSKVSGAAFFGDPTKAAGGNIIEHPSTQPRLIP